MAMGGKQTVYRGHEGVREWLRDLYETLSEFRAEYPEIRDLGDRTVAIGHVRARGTASEAEIESAHATVVEFKNGKGVRIRTYLDPQEALKAAGLSD
jgi:ketosteroid isomerase-like protein